MNRRFFPRMLCGFFIAGSLLSSSCDPERIPDDQILVMVNVKGVLSSTQALQVKSSLNGKSDPDGLTITNNTTKFAIRFPRDPKNYGALRVDGFALDGNQCYLANGQVTEQITDAKTYYELDLTLTPSAFPMCSLAVKIMSSGNETVTSTPLGINCGGGQTVCSFDFPYGTPVVLQGTSNHTKYPVWISGCTAQNTYYSPSCTATLQKGGTTATVDFVQRPCSPDGYCQYLPQLIPGSTSLYDVFGTDGKNGWIGGNNGTILNGNGGAWAQKPFSPFGTNSIQHIRGTGPNNMYAAVSSTGLAKWDGNMWTMQPAWPNMSNTSLRGIHVAGPNDVLLSVRDFTAGTELVYRFNGSTYAPITPKLGVGESLGRLWGFGANNVWLVASQGLYRFDGSAWTKETSAVLSGKSISYLWGPSANDLWAATSSELFHFDGSAWSAMPLDNGVANPSIRNLGGGKGPEVWMPSSTANGRMLRHAGGSCTSKCWTEVVIPNAPNVLNAVWGPDNNDLWAVGNSGMVYHYDGQTWTRSPYFPAPLTTSTIYGITGTGSPNTVRVFGPSSLALTVDENNAVPVPNFTTGTSSIRAVYAFDQNDIVAVGANGLMMRYNGTSWQTIATGVTNYLYGVYVSPSPKYYYIAGSSGYLARTDSNFATWTPGVKNIAWSGSFYAMAGDRNYVIATSYNGTIYRTSDGTNWTQSTTGGTGDLLAAGYSSYHGMLVGGYNGSLYRISASSGTVYQTYSTGTTANIYAIYGSNVKEFWIGGASGTLLKYDGSTFVPQKTGTTNYIFSIWGNTNQDVWFGGDYGMLMRWKQ